jgi:hypothetical protein
MDKQFRSNKEQGLTVRNRQEATPSPSLRYLHSLPRPGDAPLIDISLDQMLQLGGRHCLVVENPTTPLLP